MKGRYYKTAPRRGGRFNFGGVLQALMPLVLPIGIVVGLVILIKSLKLEGLFSGLRNIINGGSQGGAAAIDTANNIQTSLKDKFEKNGHTISGAEMQVANNLYAALNVTGFGYAVKGMFSTALSHEDSVRVAAILQNPAANDASEWTTSTAGIFLAYGVRTLNSRQNSLLGFLWDETTGTLLTHLSRYLNDDLGQLKNDILSDIQNALNEACK